MKYSWRYRADIEPKGEGDISSDLMTSMKRYLWEKWKLISHVLKHKIVKDVIWTTILSTVGKSFGFLIPFFIAAWFGVGKETDAFFFAYGLIIFLATIFSPVVEGIIVPFIAEARAKGADIGAFVGRILGMSAAGLCALSALFLLVIKPLLAVVTRFSPEGLSLIYIILLESILLVVLLVWTSILAGSLNAYKVFGIPALSPAFRAIATLSFIFTLKDLIGVHAIAWGYVVGEVFRLCILLLMLHRVNIFRIKISLGWDEKFSDFFKTSSYQVTGMSILAFTPVINKIMASWLGHGNVSLLEYADRLYMIPVAFLSSGLIVTLLPHWSERYQANGNVKLKNDVSKAIKIVGILSILLTGFLLLIKGYLVDLVYGYGKFPKEKINVIKEIFGFYLIGIAPYFLSQLYVRAFLTKKNTKVLLSVSIIMFIGTLIFNLIFTKLMGVSGIAMSASTVAVLCFGFLSFNFKKE
jgi:putative peptidoglycan lipid II flippase